MLQSFNYIVSFLIICAFFSCDKQVETPVSNPQYFIKISADDFEGKFVYLYQISPNLTLVDSTLITNRFALFEGNIDFPERYILTLTDIKGGKLFIVENDSIEISVDKLNLPKSKIKGSKINDELIVFQNKSNQITSKIETLFPDLQRARLNNDAKSLEKISNQITEIEQENINFNFDYVSQHPDSFLSAMILNDLSKRENIDADKISKAYQSLIKNVKQSIDSKEVGLYLKRQL